MTPKVRRTRMILKVNSAIVLWWEIFENRREKQAPCRKPNVGLDPEMLYKCYFMSYDNFSQ